MVVIVEERITAGLAASAFAGVKSLNAISHACTPEEFAHPLETEDNHSKVYRTKLSTVSLLRTLQGLKRTCQLTEAGLCW